MPVSTASSRVRYIFTYGTLMSSAEGSMGAAERTLLQCHARSLGAALTRGRMFDAGACPGVVLGGGPREIVHGEVWHMPEEKAELLAALDRYEGCAPSSPLPHPYARRRLRLRTSDGRRVTAWIYVWLGQTRDLPRIVDGRWRGSLRGSVGPVSTGQHLEDAAA